MKQSHSKVGNGRSLSAPPVSEPQATTRDFNLPRQQICDPKYDFTALHAWFGEAHIQAARIALAKAGVVASQNTTKPLYNKIA